MGFSGSAKITGCGKRGRSNGLGSLLFFKDDLSTGRRDGKPSGFGADVDPAHRRLRKVFIDEGLGSGLTARTKLRLHRDWLTWKEDLEIVHALSNGTQIDGEK